MVVDREPQQAANIMQGEYTGEGESCEDGCSGGPDRPYELTRCKEVCVTLSRIATQEAKVGECKVRCYPVTGEEGECSMHNEIEKGPHLT